MIDHLRGRLVSKSPEGVVVEVGGVGFAVQVPLSALERLPAVGTEVHLHTHLHVREDALQLFGFSCREDRDLYLRLTGISGIGPRLALGILSGTTAERLRLAVESEDVAALARLPGLGKKTAAKVIFELKGRLPRSGAEEPAAAEDRLFGEALSALTNLGYRKAEAETALRAVAPLASLETAVKAALKRLAPSREA